jgi:chromosome segregation ATPase
MLQSFKKQGRELISSTLAQFKKTKQDLEQGVVQCNDSISHIDSVILELESEKQLEQAAIKEASSVISHINAILGTPESDKADDTDEHY